MSRSSGSPSTASSGLVAHRTSTGGSAATTASPGAESDKGSDSRPPRPPSPSPSPPSPPHVDIISYPSADLLRLLAALLEQIAHANDQLNQRAAAAAAAAAASTGAPPTGSAAAAAAGMATPGQQPPRPGDESAEADLARGTLDAAPVTPRRRHPTDGDDMDTETEADDTLPVTPGVDLLNEVDAHRPGVAGFMPSLGGAHTPVPLSRRRGSSFLRKHDAPTGPISAAVPEPPLTSLLTASSLALSSPSATLCFHARNVPAISIEAYLLRILKYCPTTNEVFLSLLVYFDRMARVGLEAQRVGLVPQPPGDGPPPRLFAIDSFNVHRLVIAGVTVASKFFSDVFYTNSRYAKVGGLPLNELNQLELQFLLLNDFRLVIPLDELQRYADQLILFWVGRNRPAPRPPSTVGAIDVPNRPRSIRSEPSSSGTSVTSTVTPGTPSTPRASEDGSTADSGSDDDDDDGEQHRGEVAIPMDED